MKRLLPLVLMAVVCFATGWVCAQIKAIRRFERFEAYRDEQQESKVKFLREQIFDPVYFQKDGMPLDQESALKEFRPSKESSVSLSYVGGMGAEDRGIMVTGSGAVTFSVSGVSQEQTPLEPSRCGEFFRRVIGSGLATYSEGVVELKRSLQDLNEIRSVTDAPTTRFHIRIPELQIDHEFEIYTPEIQLRNYPDIVEYQSAVAIAAEMNGFVPDERRRPTGKK